MEEIELLKEWIEETKEEIEQISNSYYYDGNEIARESVLASRWETYHRLCSRLAALEKGLDENV